MAPNLRVVCAVVEREGRYLITQRRATAVLPLLWEFPGGRVENGESDEDALRRELMHRLGVDVRVGQMISYVHHPYERYAVDLYLYECELVGGEPTSCHVSDFRWALSSDFESYAFTPADEASVSQLLGVDGKDDT